jgi:hypothetical protein
LGGSKSGERPYNKPLLCCRISYVFFEYMN